MAQKAGKQFPLSSLKRAVDQHGFSVIINRVNYRLQRVQRLCILIAQSLGHPVDANLYLTPPEAQAFEEHFARVLDGSLIQARELASPPSLPVDAVEGLAPIHTVLKKANPLSNLL